MIDTPRQMSLGDPVEKNEMDRTCKKETNVSERPIIFTLCTLFVN